jgi:hypothetical protein
MVVDVLAEPTMDDLMTIELGGQERPLYCTFRQLRQLEQAFKFEALDLGRLVDVLNTQSIDELLTILHIMLADPELTIDELAGWIDLKTGQRARTAIDIAFRRSYGMPDQDEAPAEATASGEAPGDA